MNFVSLQFIVFLAATWVLFVTLPVRSRPALLLAASYIFYASWSMPAIRWLRYA